MSLPPSRIRIPADPAKIREVYIDETSQTKHRYLLLGGVTVPALKTVAADEAIVRARHPELPFGEMKWGKVSLKKIAAYERVVDIFFDSSLFADIHFHSLVIDTHKIDDKEFNEGDREIGFNKEIYQLAAKCARLYNGFFHVYPDYRDTSQRPEQLREILNYGRRKSNDLRDWPFRRCQFRDSKKTLMLQLTDLLLGAVAYKVNGHGEKDGASQAKTKFSDYILYKANVRDAMKDTAMSGKFTIWHRQLQQRPR